MSERDDDGPGPPRTPAPPAPSPADAAAGAPRARVDHDGATLVAPGGVLGAGLGPGPTAASASLLAGPAGVPASGALSFGSGASSLPASAPPELLAGRYEVLGLIGAGGMGSVYRARDRELDEVVALKVLRSELANTADMLERFRREVKLARRVTHRNVARVFDIGEHAGFKFLTMEFVDGESLAALLEREGRLTLARAIDIARAICDGLASAHAAGVVHRDLKPDNVLLSRDGRVVLTDFGIARALAVPGAVQTMGLVVGTPAYMAPEQVEGRPDVDSRADVYAFGALFYEMLTGARAWPGDAPFAVAAARLVSPVPDPRAQRPELPAPLAEIVVRCMARAVDERIGSIDEVARALAALGLPALSLVPSAPLSSPAVATLAAGLTPRPVAEKTVAVLPFRNAGPPEDAYLADELTDDLIDNLSMTAGLRVSSRGTVARYKDTSEDTRAIGRDLGVRVVVEGSVRRARDRVRISARLVSVADGFQLWAKRFDRPAEDVLTINDEAAAAIAAALTVEHQKSERDAPSNPAALDLYLRARHEYRKFWPEHQKRAIALFEEALGLAPDDPMILSGLALALSRFLFFTGDRPERAREIADRAVASAAELADAHLAQGSVALQSGDNELAVRALRRAITLGPRLAEAHAALGRVLIEAGAQEEGMRRLEVALALDPEVPLAASAMARSHALAGEFDASEALLERMRATDSEFSIWTIRARLVSWQRDRARAAELVRQLEARADLALVVPLTLLRIQATGRFPQELEGMLLPRDGEGSPRRRAFFAQLEAEISSLLGDEARSFDALGRAVGAGLIDFAWIDRCPLFATMRADPRFVPLHAAVRARAERIIAAYRAA